MQLLSEAASIALKIETLISILSGPDSWIYPASAQAALRELDCFMRPRTSLALGVRIPISASCSTLFSTFDRKLFNCSGSESKTLTLTPALAKTIAQPSPIAPAPMIAAFSIFMRDRSYLGYLFSTPYFRL